MFQWTDQSMDWYEQAALHCDFHRRVACLAQPSLEGCDTIADLGCGLGYLSMELSSFCRRMICVDVSTPALGRLAENCLRRNITNLETLEADWTLWQPHPLPDAVVLSYCNGLGRNLPVLSRLAGKVILSIMPASNEENDSYDLNRYLPQRARYRGRENHKTVVPVLQALGVPYQETPFSLPFGQWLRDEEEVKTFLEYYFDFHPTTSQLEEYLASHKAENGYYLPNVKHGYVVAVKVQDLPPRLLKGAMDDVESL